MGGVAVIAWLVSGLGLLLEVRASGVDALAWKCPTWQVVKSLGGTGAQAHSPCSVAVVLDLQRVVLVHVSVPGQRSHWLWLLASTDRIRWHRLRCALYGARPT